MFSDTVYIQTTDKDVTSILITNSQSNEAGWVRSSSGEILKISEDDKKWLLDAIKRWKKAANMPS